MASNEGGTAADGGRQRRRPGDDEAGTAADGARQRRRLDEGGTAADGARRPGDEIPILRNHILARLRQRANMCKERKLDVTEMYKRLASIQPFPEAEYQTQIEVATAAVAPLKLDCDDKKTQYFQALKKYEDMEKVRLQIMRDFCKDKIKWEQDKLLLLEEICASLDKYAA